MKKSNVFVSLCSVLIMGVGTTAIQAHAETASGKTEAKATFEAGDRPEPGKPEEGPKEPEVIDPDPTPLPEANNVYVTHLPNLSFGSNKSKANTAEYAAVMEKRTKNQGASTYYMPHSVQVADVSGSGTTKWSLSVQQETPFKTADNASQQKASRIRIYGNTLTSSAYSASDLAGKINGVQLAEEDGFGTFAQIPVAGETTDSLTVLESKTAGFTLNSYTSSVFEKGYEAANYDEAKTPSEARYNGLRLNVPANDRAQVKDYSAVLTWTLTVEP